MKRKLLATTAALAVSLTAACDGAGQMTVENDETVLDSQVELTTETVQLELTASSSDTGITACKNSKLTATANITAPTSDGVALQANSITLIDGYGIVGFNVAGDDFRGGLQLLDLTKGSPKLLTQAVFAGQDVTAVRVDDDALFVGLSEPHTDGTLPATVSRLELDSKKHIVVEAARAQLPSYAVTGMVYTTSGSSKSLYVTVGDAGGGLYKLDAKTLKTQGSLALGDVRGVAVVNSSRVAVLKGSPGEIVLVNTSTMKEENRVSLTGLSVKYAKATIQVYGNHALVGASDGGFQVVDLTARSVRSTVVNPAVAGLDASLVVTNAASAEGNRVFLANGGAGMRYACLNLPTTQLSGTNLSVAASLVGNIVLGTGESVNDVAYSNGQLIAPSGRGGVRIVQVQ